MPESVKSADSTATECPSWVTEVRNFLEEIVPPSDRLLIAVSGGADSVGLLHLLAEELYPDSIRMIAGHINHGIRPEAKADEDFVRDLADRYRIRFEVRRIDAPALAKSQRLSMEQAARTLRYQALKDIADDCGARWILTGHTKEDSAETVLMRMQSGAPWYEWTGIPRIRGNILRPLLSVNRFELKDYILSNGLTFREDSSNTDRSFSRNLLRSRLLLKPAYWSSGMINDLTESGRELEQSLRFYRNLCHILPLTTNSDNCEDRVGLEIDKILRYFQKLAFLPVEAAWSRLAGNPENRLPSRYRRQVAACLRGRSPRARILLPGNIQLIRQGGAVWLSKKSSERFQGELKLGENYFPAGLLKLSVVPRSRLSNTSTVGLSLRCLSSRLMVRNPLPGDRLQAVKRPNKKVTDILREMGWDPFRRENALVLADEQGPMMILGGPVAERVLVKPADKKVLEIYWEAGQNDNIIG